ncbi:MAG: hypothetical protein KJ749_01795 [Planctomycetes bacterium]|nr:hypothetical protein [Planctomycetota bacterium]
MVEKGGTSKLQLTERDSEILAHIRCFRMSTYEVLHRLFFEGNELDAVKSWVRRLRDAGHLDTADLIYPRKYVYLTPKAVVRLYGDSGKGAKPLGVYALARQFAVLSFCCLGDTLHRKLTVAEFRAKFPTLAENTLPKDFYYVDKDTSPQRLGFIYVDHGGSHPRRIYDRYRRIVTQRFKFPTWRREVIDRDRFIVAVVTAKSERKKRIEEAFAEHLAPHAGKRLVPHRIDVVPDLIHLI